MTSYVNLDGCTIPGNTGGQDTVGTVHKLEHQCRKESCIVQLECGHINRWDDEVINGYHRDPVSILVRYVVLVIGVSFIQDELTHTKRRFNQLDTVYLVPSQVKVLVVVINTTNRKYVCIKSINIHI